MTKEFNLQDLSKQEASDLMSNIINHLVDNIVFTQKKIAEYVSIDTTQISDLKKQKRSASKYIKKYILEFIDTFKIDLVLDNNKWKPTGGLEPKVVYDKHAQIFNIPKNRVFPSYFKTSEGSRWRIYSLVEGDKIAIRYLYINSPNEVKYIVGSKRHRDYIGYGKMDNSREFLIFALLTEVSLKKELRVIFWIGDTEATPDIMLGTLTYVDSKIHSHLVVAEKMKPDEEGVLEYTSIEDFKGNDIVKKYLKSKNSFITSPVKVLKIEDLKLLL